jgi:carbamoyl-phosphate synthase large subunit
LLESARRLHEKGYDLYATGGSQQFLNDNGIPATQVFWPNDNEQPNALELIQNKKIDLVVNIPKNFTTNELDNGYKIRRAAIDFNVPLLTNSRLAAAFIQAFCKLDVDAIEIKRWDEYE